MAPDRWVLDPTSQRMALTILRRGPISRADLGRRLDLSSASVTRLTRPLVQAGLLVEGPPRGRTTGRPALPLDIAADSATFVGLKISHLGVHAVLTNLRGTILDTAARAGHLLAPAEVSDAVGALVADLTRGRRRPMALGASLGATVGDDGLVRGARFLGWDDPVDLGAMLEEAAGLPVTIDNDVNAFTVAEHWFGAGRDVEDFAVLTIGAGVGLGLVAGDELVRGHAGAAGMVGPLTVLGGQRAQDVLHRDALEARASALAGRPVTADDLPRLAGEVPALAGLLDDVADAVGQLAGMVTAIMAPARVLVAGEGAPLLTGRVERLRAQVAALSPDHLPVPDVVVDVVGDDEWSRGAAALAIRSRMGGGWG